LAEEEVVEVVVVVEEVANEVDEAASGTTPLTPNEAITEQHE
jgi:hypothetical protein